MSLIQVEDYDNSLLYFFFDRDKETALDLADYVRRYFKKTGERVTLKLKDDIELDPDDKLRSFLMENHGDEAIGTVYYMKASFG